MEQNQYIVFNSGVYTCVLYILSAIKIISAAQREQTPNFLPPFWCPQK